MKKSSVFTEQNSRASLPCLQKSLELLEMVLNFYAEFQEVTDHASTIYILSG